MQRSSSSSFGSGSRRSNYSRQLDLANEDLAVAAEYGIGGAMLPLFLNDIRATQSDNRNDQELVEVELELAENNITLRSVTPTATMTPTPNRLNIGDDHTTFAGKLTRSVSHTSQKLRNKLGWWLARSTSWKSSASSVVDLEQQPPSTAAPAVHTAKLDELRLRRQQLKRNGSSAQRALRGLRFISKTTAAGTGGPMVDAGQHLWKQVEARFDKLQMNGLISREHFGECIGMMDSKEFAEEIFDALARRKRQRMSKITKEELYDFWLQLSDQSFDARLQIFFDMADRNEDGRINRKEVQELIMLSASANKLSCLKEKAHEYATLIMEELDPDDLGYIELWQLETLLLQRETYMEYSRPLSTTSFGLSQNLSAFRPKAMVRRFSCTLKCLILENWQRGWIIMLWLLGMAALFGWKFYQYRQRAAFQVMGYCLCTAKGAAETLKLNMALILLPVCRNILTWLRSTRARLLIPFDDNINFHKTIAFAIAIGVLLHAGNHLVCDFPRLINSSPEKFALIASDFNGKKPTYVELLKGIEGLTGIGMVILMAISFTLATSQFRRNVVKFPAPFNRLAGYNAFWYTHHLLGVVYLLLIVHGIFLFLVQTWYQKTTWMYISIPLIFYVAERSLRACRSESYSVKILKASELPGSVFTLILSKPQGFKYRSGQYVFLQCPAISKFEWHPFSITSAPGDNYLSVHIRVVGDWTQELQRVFTEGNGSASAIGRLNFDEEHMDQRGLPKLLVDGPYGAPAQDYQNYDVLLLVGLGIGATPFISVLRDLLNNSRAVDRLDSTTEASTSDDSLNSFGSSLTSQGGKKKPIKIKSAHFYWVTREPGSFEWFKGLMDEVAEMDQKGLIDMHNYLTSVYEEGDARSTLLTMVQALNHAKFGVDILSGTRVKTHFARPNWREVFGKIAKKHPYCTVGVFYCGKPVLAKELKKLSHEISHKSSTRFEFHKEQF